MSSVSDNVYYNFEIVNNSANTLLCDQTDNNLRSILPKANDYSLCIVKFSLPASEIDAYRISNDNDYRIQYSIPYNSFTTPINTLQTAEVSRSLFRTSAFRMRTFEDFIENYNRSSLLCYRDLLGTMSDAGFGNKVTKTGTLSWGTPATTDHVKEFTVNSSHGTLSGLKLGYLQMTIGLSTLESFPYAVGSVMSDHLFEISLTSPDGKRCYVSSNANLSVAFIDLSPGAPEPVVQTITFEDGSLRSQTDVDITQKLKGDYQPLESFTKFSDGQNKDGNWTVRIRDKNSDPDHPFHGFMNYTINFYYCPKLENGNEMKFPNMAPVLAHNETTNKLEMIYHEQTALSNFRIGFTPQLNQLLGFNSTAAIDGYNAIKLPQYFISANEDQYITQSQPISTTFLLTDIQEIQIRTSNLPISAEFSNISRANIVMSINTSTDTQKDVYEYFANEQYLRLYDLITNTEIRDINFSVWVKYRSNGEEVQVYLPVNLSFSMLIKFIRRR